MNNKHLIEQFEGLSTEIMYQYKSKDSSWPCFKWLLVINGVSFEYSTGLGHAVPLLSKDNKRRTQPLRSFLLKKSEGYFNGVWVSVPKVIDILDCLFRESTCSYMTFDDFCDAMGYSNDSIKALDTYRAIQNNTAKLKKALGHRYDEIETKITEMEL
jgi:hypothetical protein